MPNAGPVLVIGAASQIGYHLLPMLVAAKREVVALSRAPAPGDTRGAAWYRLDPTNPEALRSSGWLPRYVINLAPIRILPPLIDALADLGTSRMIAFSSTSRFTKADSDDPTERDLAALLAHSEDAVARNCGRHGIDWTIFRPTLVYSPGLDRNVSEIARFILRFGFFPIVGAGIGKRQPVHAADLAAACVAALDDSRADARTYNLTGSEILSYREMVERIFRGLGRGPRIVSVPPRLLKAAVNAARVVPRFRKLSPELVTRMNADLCFDHDEAFRDLGFRPRPFEFHIESEFVLRSMLDSGFAR
jgi:nucleoside-diphosphate-sugar epimerase